jgi:hypothetical protein
LQSPFPGNGCLYWLHNSGFQQTYQIIELCEWARMKGFSSAVLIHEFCSISYETHIILFSFKNQEMKDIKKFVKKKNNL